MKFEIKNHQTGSLSKLQDNKGRPENIEEYYNFPKDLYNGTKDVDKISKEIHFLSKNPKENEKKIKMLRVEMADTIAERYEILCKWRAEKGLEDF